MKHSPHCIPPAEVGDPGVCICDGRGNPVCPPESGCAECHPTVARPSNPHDVVAAAKAYYAKHQRWGSHPEALCNEVERLRAEAKRAPASILIEPKGWMPAWLREFYCDCETEGEAAGQCVACQAANLIESHGVVADSPTSETLAVDPDDAPEISDEHMSALATKVTLEAQRWTFFKNGMDESDKLRMLADGTDHYDATIDCLRRAAQKANAEPKVALPTGTRSRSIPKTARL